MSKSQAIQAKFKVFDEKKNVWLSDGGLFFPFPDDKSYGQIRFNKPISYTRKKKNKTVKYLSPVGEAKAYVPEGAEFVCEGFKDTITPLFKADTTGACLLGVSHFRKLPLDCGLIIVFDHDCWVNPKVARSLLSAAFWCSSTIQVVPEVEGFPKAGLCEWFKLGATKTQFEDLLAKAMSPDQFLVRWADKWQHYDTGKKAECLKVHNWAVENWGAQ